jgi:hypothetical protein
VGVGVVISVCLPVVPVSYSLVVVCLQG